MLGPEADCANIKEPYPGILATLKQVKIPIASVDVPSGKCSHKRYISLRLMNTTWLMSLQAALLELWLQSKEVFQVWRHIWRINLMLKSVQRELITLWMHYLLSVSTTGRELSQCSSLLFVFRLGRRGTESGRDKPWSSHLAHGTKEVCYKFLWEAFLGRTLPALRHTEKIWA